MIQYINIIIFLFLVVAVVSSAQNAHFELGYILFVSVLNAVMIEPPAITLGINIYLHDVVYAGLLLSALIRIFFNKEIFFLSPIWMGYGLILSYSLLVGLNNYGTAAGVDFRNFFYYWSGTLYFMSFPYTKEILDKMLQYWIAICSVLLIIFYFRFVAESLNLPISFY